MPMTCTGFGWENLGPWLIPSCRVITHGGEDDGLGSADQGADDEVDDTVLFDSGSVTRDWAEHWKKIRDRPEGEKFKQHLVYATFLAQLDPNRAQRSLGRCEAQGERQGFRGATSAEPGPLRAD